MSAALTDVDAIEDVDDWDGPSAWAAPSEVASAPAPAPAPTPAAPAAPAAPAVSSVPKPKMYDSTHCFRSGRSARTLTNVVNFHAGMAHAHSGGRDFFQRVGPANPHSKPIPVGQANCLADLTFVFTGELDSTPRMEAEDLVKRYGGYALGAPARVARHLRS